MTGSILLSNRVHRLVCHTRLATLDGNNTVHINATTDKKNPPPPLTTTTAPAPAICIHPAPLYTPLPGAVLLSSLLLLPVRSPSPQDEVNSRVCVYRLAQLPHLQCIGGVLKRLLHLPPREEAQVAPALSTAAGQRRQMGGKGKPVNAFVLLCLQRQAWRTGKQATNQQGVRKS